MVCAKARVKVELAAVLGLFLLEKLSAWSLQTPPVSGVTATGGKMKHVKSIVTTFIAIFLFGAIFYGVAPAQGDAQPSDPAAYYKAKCVACHGQKAEKKFDTTLTEEHHLDAILKGKKPEKPPNMPAYGDKGVSAEQAKALLEYMKQLKASQ